MHAARSLPLVLVFCALLALPTSAFGAAPRADLRVLTVANPPASRQAQTTFSVAASVTNSGRARSAATSTSFWLSRDRRRGADRILRIAPTSRLAPRARIGARSVARATASTPPGRYYILACADHGRRVREMSEANNCTASRGRITIVRPRIAITAPAAGSTTAGSSAFTFTSNIAVNATCSVDGAAPFVCVSGTTSIVAATGQHTLRVRAVDPAGNVATATSTWTVDATDPVLTVTSGPTSSQTISTADATWTFSTDETATFLCSLDRVSAPCTSPHTVTGLTDDTHDLRIYATDAVGNVSSTRIRFHVDAV